MSRAVLFASATTFHSHKTARSGRPSNSVGTGDELSVFLSGSVLGASVSSPPQETAGTSTHGTSEAPAASPVSTEADVGSATQLVETPAEPVAPEPEAPAADQAPPVQEPASDNSPVIELPATGTE